MANPRVVLAGGSGFLGQALAARFIAKNYDVVVLSRGAARLGRLGTFQTWDGSKLGPWTDSLDGASAVINLTGKSINCRQTLVNQRAIVQSRVNSVAVLAQAVRKCKQPPAVFVQTSAVGIYGDRGDEVCDESTSPGQGFLAETCVAWERAFSDAELSNVRNVVLRLGVVLGKRFGAFPVLESLTRFFMGGAAGSGRQYVSWLHLKDAEAIFLRAAEDSNMQGAYVAASPEPVTNAALMRQLRTSLHRPWSPPAPAVALRIGGYVAGINTELILASQRCRPTRLLAEGFEFAYRDSGPAVENLLNG